MRAKQFTEAALGTNPKRPARAGSRPARGHTEEPRYKNSVSKDEEDKFHLKLDKLVHNTFGPSPDEVKEGADERKQNALWAQITQHEKQAKATKNDIKKQHHLKMADQLRGQLKTSDLEEGEVVAFPKKHRGDLEDTHECPKCGGDLQGGKYMGHQVKVCMPCKQVYLPPNSGIDKHGNKIDETNKHSIIGKFKRGEELYNKVKSSFKDIGDAQKAGDSEAASKAFKKHEKYANLRAPGTWNKVDEIAGAFPSPSTREKWAKDAAASNAAEAKRLAAKQAQADANRLAVNNPQVARLNQVNYHGANAPKPSNATWDGDSDFLELNGTKYAKASRMPIPGGEAPDMKLIVTQEGWQVYIWTRNSLKGVVGRYFYPAEKPNTIQESKTVKQDANKPRNFVAKNAINTGAGAHKDKKKAEKQGDFKHKKQAIPMDEAMQELEAAFKEEKAPRALCVSSKPDEDLGASQLASCKSQGLRARDGNKSHKLGKSPKSRVKVGGKRIKGNKYGGPLPDWS